MAPRYDYTCPAGHTTEHELPFGEAPTEVICTVPPSEDPNGVCGLPAIRQFSTGTTFVVNKVMNTPSKRKRGSGGS